MRKVLTTALMAALAMGCGKKKDSTGGSSDKAAEGGSAAAVTLPPLKADPEMPAITPSDKKPEEAVKFRQLDTRSEKGWPKYEAWNTGTKTVKFLAIYGYAYDKDGKQVAHTKTPLSWNGSIEAGKKSDFDIEIGGFPEDQVPATAASYELCYDSIEYDGDKDFTNISGHCPDEKPKGK